MKIYGYCKLGEFPGSKTSTTLIPGKGSGVCICFRLALFSAWHGSAVGFPACIGSDLLLVETGFPFQVKVNFRS